MIRKLVFVFLLVNVAIVICEESKERCLKKPEGDAMHCCLMPINNQEKIINCLQDQTEGKDAGCPSNCFFDGIEVVKDGKVDRATLLSTAKNMFAGSDHGFDSLHERAVDYCIEMYTQMAQQHTGKPKNPNCNRSKSAIAWCLHGYYFMNCPAAVWTVSEQCTAFKKFATDCPPIQNGQPGRRQLK